MLRPPSRALALTPFSFCRLPTGTTRLELVTSGRSVAISSFAVGQDSARASIAPGNASADSTLNQRRTLCRLTTHLIGASGGQKAFGLDLMEPCFIPAPIRIATDVAEPAKQPSCFVGSSRKC